MNIDTERPPVGLAVSQYLSIQGTYKLTKTLVSRAVEAFSLRFGSQVRCKDMLDRQHIFACSRIVYFPSIWMRILEKHESAAKAPGYNAYQVPKDLSALRSIATWP